jgi:hypothetical protein
MPRQERPNDPEGLLCDPGFPSLKELLTARPGLAYFADRDKDLADRLARRLAPSLPAMPLPRWNCCSRRWPVPRSSKRSPPN